MIVTRLRDYRIISYPVCAKSTEGSTSPLPFSPLLSDSTPIITNLNINMADISESPTQNILVRPPYNWWDSHPPYIHSTGVPTPTTAVPSIPSSRTIDFLHPSYD